jgi:hypothetical protein
MTQTNEHAERWHDTVSGTWHGWPSIFDAQGNHVGHVRADRRISRDGGAEPVIRVPTTVDVQGLLRSRLEHREHLLRVTHVDGSRVYLGPDFYGAGHPFGSCLVGNDYCVPWASDNQVMVQVLEDGRRQVYSTLLYQGPAIHAVITGLYLLTTERDAGARDAVDAHLARERRDGARPYVLEGRPAGSFGGALEIFAGDQSRLGRCEARLRYVPVGPQRAETSIALGGVIGREFRTVRSRHQNQHFFEGPDLWGNGIGYGRALFTVQHVRGEPLRIRGREFLIDDDQLAVAWEFLRADRREQLAFGTLHWKPD